MRRDSSTLLILRQRSLAALVVGIALAFGAVAPHDPASEHTGRMNGAIVDQAARHPEAPPHFEASQPAYEPGCETCLMLIQTGSRLIAPPVPLPELVRGEAVAVAQTATVSATSSLLLPARAPPASSIVL